MELPLIEIIQESVFNVLTLWPDIGHSIKLIFPSAIVTGHFSSKVSESLQSELSQFLPNGGSAVFNFLSETWKCCITLDSCKWQVSLIGHFLCSIRLRSTLLFETKIVEFHHVMWKKLKVDPNSRTSHPSVRPCLVWVRRSGSHFCDNSIPSFLSHFFEIKDRFILWRFGLKTGA